MYTLHWHEQENMKGVCLKIMVHWKCDLLSKSNEQFLKIRKKYMKKQSKSKRLAFKYLSWTAGCSLAPRLHYFSRCHYSYFSTPTHLWLSPNTTSSSPITSQCLWSFMSSSCHLLWIMNISSKCSWEGFTNLKRIFSYIVYLFLVPLH